MAISDLTQAPTLVYRVNFTAPYPIAVAGINAFNQQIFVATSGGPGEIALPGRGFLAAGSVLQADGLHLAITRSAAAKSAGTKTDLLCTLIPAIPPWMRRFRVSADFVLDRSSGGPVLADAGDTWAATVFARDADQGDQVDTLTATVVGATQQVRGGSPVQITLGAADAQPVSPRPGRTLVPANSVYNTTNDAFTLAAFLDCDAGTGQSELTTADGYHWENSWPHSFVDSALPLYVGFGIAITPASGAFTARVIVRQFSVLLWPEPSFVPEIPPLSHPPPLSS